MDERQLHVAFVARDPDDRKLKAVGLYAAADVIHPGRGWVTARTRFAELVPAGERPEVKEWPGNQGMRRWAKRAEARGREYEHLWTFFYQLAKRISGARGLPDMLADVFDDGSGVDGKKIMRWIQHRMRERGLRERKIQQAMRMNHGRLVCEVPGCGFDFQSQYGKLGAGFAEVHHKKPLSYAPKRGQKTMLAELAVVCANCHRMIHRDGKCRPLDRLMPD